MSSYIKRRPSEFLSAPPSPLTRWPERVEGRRLRVSGELGYAPQTPTEAGIEIGTTGDEADGLAWNFTASVMDFLPRHSIGINYGRTDPGWLLSPQYRNNDELFEIRYLWRRNRNLAIDIRARWRTELDRLTTAERKRDQFDVFVRFTWGFTVKGLL